MYLCCSFQRKLLKSKHQYNNKTHSTGVGHILINYRTLIAKVTLKMMALNKCACNAHLSLSPYLAQKTHVYKYTLGGPLNLAGYVSLAPLAASDSLSPARPGLAELSVIGPWLAPLCPAINPNPPGFRNCRPGQSAKSSPLLLSSLYCT